MCVFALAAAPVAAGAAGGAAAAGGSLFTMANIAANASLFAGIGSMGMSMMSGYQQSKAAEAQASYQSAMAENARIVSEYKAKDALRQGEEEERRQRLKVAQIKGRQINQLASSGMLLDGGTNADLLADTDVTGELDALAIRDNAERQAWSFRVQGANQVAEAELMSNRADNYASSRPLSLGGDLLSGVGTVADRWYRYRLPVPTGKA